MNNHTVRSGKNDKHLNDEALTWYRESWVPRSPLRHRRTDKTHHGCRLEVHIKGKFKNIQHLALTKTHSVPLIYIRLLKKTHQFLNVCQLAPTHQIFMKIGKTHPQSVFGNSYKNHTSNLCSIEDIIQNVPEVRFFPYHYALFYQIYRT